MTFGYRSVIPEDTSRDWSTLNSAFKGQLVEFSDWSAWLSKFDLLSKVVFNVLPNFLV